MPDAQEHRNSPVGIMHSQAFVPEDDDFYFTPADVVILRMRVVSP